MHLRPLLLLALLLAFPAPLRAGLPGPPAILNIIPPPGPVNRFTQITVVFSEPVTNVDAADLRLNDFPANTVSGAGTNFTFAFSKPADGRVQVVLAGLSDLDLPANALPTNRWEYTLVTSATPIVTNVFPAVGSVVRSLGQVEVSFSEPVKGLEAADLLVNGLPATNLLVKAGGSCTFQFVPPPPGPVVFTWAANHGITNYSATPTAFLTNAWTCTLNPSVSYPSLLITEICAANRNGLQDEDGFASDWLELFNPTPAPVNLADWSLSDDPLEPGKWVFPNRVLESGQYLVLFASAKDRKAPTGANRFHLNFTLSAGGEFLGLYTPESPRVLQTGFSPGYPEQCNDYSYGLDATDQWRYFAVPTPGTANGSSAITNFVQPMHFSVERGFFTQPFDLVLTTTTPGATIRYSTDGSEPGPANGLVYSNALRIATNAVLRAAAFRTGFAPSIIRTHTYLFGQSAAILSLPVLSLVTATNNLIGSNGITGISVSNYVSGVWTALGPSDYDNNLKFGLPWERPVSAEFIRSADNGGFQIDCGLRVNGSDYTRPRYTPVSKFSYRLYFRGDYGEKQLNYALFPTSPLQSFDAVTLRAGHNDISNPFIKDELSRRLHADMGHSAAQGTFVNLFVNGVYKGYYNPTERVDEDSMAAWDGTGSDWDRITIGSVVQTGDNASWTELRNIFSTGQDLKNPLVYQDVAHRLDLTNFVDYLLLEIYGANWDWPQNNWRAGRERSTNGLWRFYAWDIEAAFDIGQRPPTVDIWTTTNRIAFGSSTAEIPTFYRGLTNNAEFRLLFADRIQRHFFNGGALTDGHITNRFLEMKSVLAGVIPSMNLLVITNWVPNRREPLFSQFVGYGLYVSNAPVFNQASGRVPFGFTLSMSAPLGGTIHYTLDGTDPREAFTDAVTTNALPYTNAFSLYASSVVKARTFNGTNWSALVEASFQMGTPGIPIRITELNYNPPGGSAYEFIELFNNGPVSVDLSGFSFDGISFTFQSGASLASGGVLVLANNDNPALFASRYPDVTVFGYYGGNLNNDGERIALKDREGNVVTAITYGTQPPWPTAPNGGGPSLALAGTAYGEPHNVLNWQASYEEFGTPGQPNPTALSLTSFVLSEVMANNVSAVNHEGTFPDWIELRNGRTFPSDLGGFSLSDDSNPRKFVFPTNTVVASNGLLVVWCDAATNTTSGLHSGFALRREGGMILLYDPYTNLVDSLAYGPQAPDYSLAQRVPTIPLPPTPVPTPRYGFRLALPTPGESNIFITYDWPPNVVINEWMANPEPGGSDWIELFNRSTNSPAELRYLFVGVGNALQQIESPCSIAPQGFARFYLDDVMAPDHLDLRLPASGGTIALYDSGGTELDRVTYSAQTEGVSRGRLPDGSANFTNFIGTASPDAPNYVINYAGPVLNEVLARNVSALTNAGHTADFIELFNPAATNFDLSGMSLSVDEQKPSQWTFPPGTVLGPGRYLAVWCDGERPASTATNDFNTGQVLRGTGGGAYLFSAAGQLVNAVEYGFQVANKPIGLSGGQWRLLLSPTPGAANASVQALGTNGTLRINEWMAQPESGPDWFELFNATNLPVALDGLFLSDDPSMTGLTNFCIVRLSFIGASNWVRFLADGNRSQGSDHVSFNLAAEGESIWLSRTNGGALSVIDSVSYGRQQPAISEGRLPDGATNVARFPGSASPGEANYLFIPNVVISEILAHAEAPLEAAIELFNPTAWPVDISGWYLSDSQDDFRKYRLPANTVLPAGGFVVVGASQFTNAAPRGFTPDGSRPGEVWLSAADGTGKLTGYRTSGTFGPATANVSFGRLNMSLGVSYVALQSPTLGASNSVPLVGPVVINEVMYHAPDGPNGAGNIEFIELLNLSTNDVPFFDPAHATNAWRLRGGIGFDFPAGSILAAGSYVLVVNFDPAADAGALLEFQTRYQVPPFVPIVGPFLGALDNAGDSIELQRPDVPVAGLVPYVLVDKLDYGNSVPWAMSANGSGASLQRREAAAFSNDPLNWFGAAPTPGLPNAFSVPPFLTLQPRSESVVLFSNITLQVAAAPGPLTYQWRFNGVNVPDATNASLFLDWLQYENEGLYDVFVSGPDGASLSTAAYLHLISPPVILVAPTNVLCRLGSNAVFSVTVSGALPLLYQWRFNGVVLPGETSAMLTRTNVQFADEGVYSVTVSNPDGVVSASATLLVTIPLGILQNPLSQVVAPGERVTLSVGVTGAPPPFTYEWKLVATPVATNVSGRTIDFFSFVAPNYPTQRNYRVVVRNPANSTGLGSLFASVTVAADTDGDGLPDPWETRYGFPTNSPPAVNQDSDQDGMSDVEEYLAGTNPTNAASLLKLDLIIETNVTALRFTAMSNRTYSVQFTDSLSGSPWQSLADVIATSSNVLRGFTDPVPRTNRFYRVVTPAPAGP